MTYIPVQFKLFTNAVIFILLFNSLLMELSQLHRVTDLQYSVLLNKDAMKGEIQLTFHQLLIMNKPVETKEFVKWIGW